MTQLYTYTNKTGQKISVQIVEDCGMVNGRESQWHKVICRPIGFNNSIPMSLDMACLLKNNNQTITPKGTHIA